MSQRVRASDLGMLLLRLGAGLTLAAHGYPKLFGGAGRMPPRILTRILGPNYPAAVQRSGLQNFSQVLARSRIPFPRLAALASGLTELGGGLALALGVATPLVAAAATFNMLVAARTAHWRNGFYGQGGYEFPLLLAVAAAAVGLIGPGALSVDSQLNGRFREMPDGMFGPPASIGTRLSAVTFWRRWRP